MRENKVISLEKRAEDAEKPFFEQLLQEGARKLLQAAIENEIIEYIQFHQDRRDEDGQRLVVRNGHLPEREIVSGVGPIKVRQPRVRHRDGGQFSSAILPKYMRRTPSVDAAQQFERAPRGSIAECQHVDNPADVSVAMCRCH